MFSIVPSSPDSAQDAASGAPVLVQSAISDRQPNLTGSMTVEVYADLLKIKKSPLGNDRKIGVHLQASKRGVIKRFSRKSRKRMIEQLAKLRDPSNGYFFTLTYPDDVPHTADKCKRDLGALRKRLLRRFPAAGGMWRLEVKPRLSGERVGLPAPHFHILVFGMPYREQLMRRWLHLTWSRIVYETKRPARRVRTRADVIHSRKHAARYAAKYAAKEETDSNIEGAANINFGRRWGYFGALDFACQMSLTMPALRVVELRRLVARWMKSRGPAYARRIARSNPHFGFSALGLGDKSIEQTGLFDSTVVRMVLSI